MMRRVLLRATSQEARELKATFMRALYFGFMSVVSTCIFNSSGRQPVLCLRTWV
jgi:hypothetical protein